MANFSFVALKDEIVNDPLGFGYKNSPTPMPPADWWKKDQVVADLLNNKDGSTPRTVTNKKVMTDDIRSATTFDGFDGLVTAEQAWFEWLTQSGEITVNPETLQQLAGIPTANDSIWATPERPAMNAAMTALMQFQGGRGLELWDKFITAGDVGRAFNEI